MNTSTSVSFPSSIMGQERATQMLSNMLRHETLHHALFFYGPPTVGKTTTAQNLVKTLNCETHASLSETSADAAPQFCNVCSACQAVNFHKTPFLLNVSLEDRIPYIRTLQAVLKRRKSHSVSSDGGSHDEEDNRLAQQLSEQLVGECYKLINRHRDNILLPLKRKKVSYPKGVIFNQKTFDKNLHELYNALERFHAEQDFSALITPAVLEILEYIQNSLDRTYLGKEGIERAFSWATQTVGMKAPLPKAPLPKAFPLLGRPPNKILILKGVEKINYAVIGKFLKILEDPIPHTRFILIAENLTELNTSVITPLLSRCFKIPFLPLSQRHTQNILTERLGVSESPAENLEDFFRHPVHGGTPSSAGQRASPRSKFALAVVQARKNSLSYIQYLAREHPEAIQTLLNDLKTGLACYLETYFIKIAPEESASQHKSNSLSHSIALAIKQIPLSLKKSLAFRALIQKCEQLKSLGIISNETIVNRLALFIRKIH